MSRTFTITLLVLLALSGFVALQPALCTTKIATPEFTVTYTDYSYNTAAYPTTDPFTGHTIEVPTTYVEDRTVQFSVKSTNYAERGELYYVIRMKGYFSQNWTSIYKGWVNGSGQESTIWTFSTFRGHNIPGNQGYFYRGGESFYAPTEGQIDFQVKAQTWGEVMADTTATNPFGGSITTLFGESDWSSTKTVTITKNAQAASPTSSSVTSMPTPPSTTPTSSNPTVTSNQSDKQTDAFSDLSWEMTVLVAGLVFAVAVLAVGMVVLWRKVNIRGTK